ncbi:MAG: hypothetical protein ACI9ON_002133 [Limisphaerales bacterium]
MKRLTYLTILLFISHSALANMQPALVGTHERSLSNRIQFPDVAGDYTVFVRCEAKVQPAGSIEETGCYDDAKVDPEFFRAVALGSSTATFEPARVEGESVAVLALYSVIFRQKGSEQMIMVVPNHGTNAKNLGMQYTAPQKYGRKNSYLPRAELGLIWIDAKMSVEGIAGDVNLLETEYSNRESTRYAKSYINNNTFIPGFANGEPAEMRFVKPIFGYRNGFMAATGDSKCGSSSILCDEVSHATGKPRYVFDD